MKIETILYSNSMENDSLQRVVTDHIREERLPLYQQAGEQTGYEVIVIARVGQSYVAWYPGKLSNKKWEDRTIVVGEGRVGVSITNPDPSRDHGPFWKALETLEDPLKSSK